MYIPPYGSGTITNGKDFDVRRRESEQAELHSQRQRWKGDWSGVCCDNSNKLQPSAIPDTCKRPKDTSVYDCKTQTTVKTVYGNFKGYKTITTEVNQIKIQEEHYTPFGVTTKKYDLQGRQISNRHSGEPEYSNSQWDKEYDDDGNLTATYYRLGVFRRKIE